MKITFAAPALPKSGVLGRSSRRRAASSAGLPQAADKRSGGHISRAIKAASFEGKRDQILDIVAAGGFDRVVVAGLGDPESVDGPRDRTAGRRHRRHSAGAESRRRRRSPPRFRKRRRLSAADAAALLASGARLRIYSFDSYKSKKPRKRTACSPSPSSRRGAAAARRPFGPIEAVAEGVHFARDLVNEPANELYPVEFADPLKPLDQIGRQCRDPAPAQMKKLGMGALLGVAQGSAHEPRLVVMRWNGGKRGETPVAFIGKGVTFDTGGISIKPAAGMEDMKGDMGGAACVAGLMLALAKRKAKVNAVGVIGLVENMPDGNAQRPGDIVKSMSGQTIAVLNTDAEGRLVLADALWYIAGPLQAEIHDRSRDADRRHPGGARQGACRAVLQQ